METKNIINKYKNPNLEKFKHIITSKIKKRIKSFDGDLSTLHKNLDVQDVNKLRIFLFTEINKLNWEQLILNLCGDEISKILGSDILVQSKINLSIQMPNDPNSLLPAHADCWSAETPFQINLWIPLTNTYETNSMFIWNERKSVNLMKRINKDVSNRLNLNKLKINKNDFLRMKYGQILIFNPALIHGNVENKTSKTRISMNLRLKSFFSPEPGSRNPDRKFGTFYKKLQITKNTKFAIDVMKSGILS